jgi:hypothetical protein
MRTQDFEYSSDEATAAAVPESGSTSASFSGSFAWENVSAYTQKVVETSKQFGMTSKRIIRQQSSFFRVGIRDFLNIKKPYT